MASKKKSKTKIIFDLLRGRIFDSNAPNWMKVFQLIAMIIFWIFVVAQARPVIISLPVYEVHSFFQGR